MIQGFFLILLNFCQKNTYVLFVIKITLESKCDSGHL